MKQVKYLTWFWSFTLLVIFLASCSQQANPNTPELTAQTNSWRSLGGALDFTVEKTPHATELLLDRTEKPVVASIEDDKKGGRKLVLQRWTGSMWQNFASPLIVPTSNYSFLVDFQIDLQNRPVVLIITGSKARGNPDFEDAAIYRYENNSWKRLGEPFDVGVHDENALAIANNGNIYALFNDYTNKKSFIRRWTGSTWQTAYTFQKITTTDYAGNPISDGTIAHGATSLRFTKTNQPVVTWNLTTDEWPLSATPLTRVEAWNGSTWTRTGEFWGELILDKNDNLLTASVDAQFSSSSSCGLDVSQGTTLTDATKSSTYKLAVDKSNRPIVAHTIYCAPDSYGFGVDAEVAKQDLVVRRWTGSSWQNVGGVMDRIAGRGANSRAILVDSKNTIYVLFDQCAVTTTTFCTNYNLYLSKYVP